MLTVGEHRTFLIIPYPLARKKLVEASIRKLEKYDGRRVL